MITPWREVTSRVGGRRAVSLRGYLLASPFWILGFVFNENVTYESWANAFSTFLIATAGHAGLGLVFLIAHVTVLRNRAHQPVSLGLAVTVWGLAGATRAGVLISGLWLLSIQDEIPSLQRVLFSALMAIAGFSVLAYALDAIDRFAAERARVLDVLLHGEEQLSAHRAAVVSMQEALVARVDKRLKESHDVTVEALNKLEDSLTSGSPSPPGLEELRNLSDSTWQKISQDLWNTAPTSAPRIRFRELLELYSTSRPFRLLYVLLVAVFLYVLLYNRVFGVEIGAALVGLWVAVALIIAVLGNWLLPSLQNRAVPAFLFLAAVLIFSSIPLLVVAQSWGYEAEYPLRVVSVHALSVVVALTTSLPSTFASARERILQGLTRSLDSTTLEKLHVESQLKVLSQKIANRLHGDVRGNFLAAILKLQDHIARGDTRAAAQEVHVLREILQQTREAKPLASNSRGNLEKFVENWTALVDIALDQPLSTVEEAYLPALHTIVVDAVNNAVRHGKATWIRIGFAHEPGALLVTIQNNGEPQQGGRSGLGTAQLDLYAPEKWSLVRTVNGLTQLLVRLEKQSLPAESLAR